VEIRDKYRAHIAAMLGLAGIADGDARATRILALETAIAGAHAPRVETEDVKHGNNHWRRDELAERAPGLDWSALLAAAGLDPQADFVIWQPAALIGIARLVELQPVETWKDYLAFHAAQRHADVLPRAFDEAHFAFYGKVLSGTPAQRERWKRAV